MNRTKNRKNKSTKKSSQAVTHQQLKQAMKALLKKTGEGPDVQSLEVARNLRSIFLKTPKGPYPGALFTDRQIAATFSNTTGLSNLGGASTAQFIVNSNTPTLASIAFELADLTQVATFSALFDAYRVERVKVHFKSRNNAISVFNVASPNSGVPTGYVVVDRDDSNAPASIAALLEYDNTVAFSGEEDFTVDLVPSVTPSVFASGAFTGYLTKPSNAGWIDIANTNVPCYGIKLGAAGLTLATTSSWVWDIVAEYIVSFCRLR